MLIKNGLGPDHIVSSTMIDADNADLTGLPTTGQPLAFYGSGRPDGLGDPSVSYNNTAIAAPTGSTYTFTGDQSELDAVFGAKVWRKGVTHWVCVEGHVSALNTTETTLTDATVYRCEYHRDGHNVTLLYQVQGPTGSAAGAPLYLHPEGFGPRTIAIGAIYWDNTQLGSVDFAGATASVNLASTKLFGAWKQISNGRTSFAYLTDAPWPSTAPTWTPQRSLAELRELIETEADPEKLQQLKEELTALTGTELGEDKEQQ